MSYTWMFYVAAQGRQDYCLDGTFAASYPQSVFAGDIDGAGPDQPDDQAQQRAR